MRRLTGCHQFKSKMDQLFPQVITAYGQMEIHAEVHQKLLLSTMIITSFVTNVELYVYDHHRGKLCTICLYFINDHYNHALEEGQRPTITIKTATNTVSASYGHFRRLIDLNNFNIDPQPSQTTPTIQNIAIAFKMAPMMKFYDHYNAAWDHKMHLD